MVFVTWLLRSIPEPYPQPHSQLLFPLCTALASGYGMEQKPGCGISNQCNAARPSSLAPRLGSGILPGEGNTGMDLHISLGSCSCAGREGIGRPVQSPCSSQPNHSGTSLASRAWH